MPIVERFGRTLFQVFSNSAFRVYGPPVTNSKGFADLIKRTIIETTDDGTKGTVDNIRFHDTAALTKVMKATTRSAERYNQAVAVCSDEIRRWVIAASDNGKDMRMFGYARAALRLQQMIEAPRYRGWLSDGGGGFSPLV